MGVRSEVYHFELKRRRTLSQQIEAIEAWVCEISETIYDDGGADEDWTEAWDDVKGGHLKRRM